LARSDIEIKVRSYLQKYFNFIEKPEDIRRILGCFEEVLAEINKERTEMHKNKGFFSVPILRLLSYFLTRLKLSSVIKS
jgi:DNA-binding NtrC family response regulator